MHRSDIRIQPQLCVFSRWSRNPAAVFHSRRMVVNIGCLKANILDRIARKNHSVTLSTVYTESDLMHPTPDDEHPETPPLLELIETALSVTTPTYPRSQSSKSNINYNKEDRTYRRVVNFCVGLCQNSFLAQPTLRCLRIRQMQDAKTEAKGSIPTYATEAECRKQHSSGRMMTHFHLFHHQIS